MPAACTSVAICRSAGLSAMLKYTKIGSIFFEKNEVFLKERVGEKILWARVIAQYICVYKTLRPVDEPFASSKRACLVQGGHANEARHE
jgi:hypothetical protein